MTQPTFKSLLFVAVLLVSVLPASAQNKNGFTYRFNWFNYATPRATDANFEDIYKDFDRIGAEFAYVRKLTSNGKTQLSVPLKIGGARIPSSATAPGRRNLVSTLDVSLQQMMFKPNRFFINPYVGAGVGVLRDWGAEKTDLNVPLFAGFNFKVAENLFFNIQTQYRWAGDERIGWHHGAGFTFLFGDDAPPPPPDTDKDGIIDVNDACPTEFGLAALQGCPDKDGDLTADKDDKCPDVAGLVALMGCPDKDGDGIADGDDTCPDVKGVAAFKGCPDTDGDGVEDSKDACPSVKGLVALKGCPDGDGDGVADKDDNCPKEKGPASNKGCPTIADRDSDGVADKDDKCPDKAGLAAHKGCPDTDGDGIFDDEDRCPEKPGIAAKKGCPDIKKEDKAKLENVIKNVQFETGKATLLTKSYAVLDEVVNLMKQYPEYSLAISGHTDNVGNPKSNLDLSDRRATACYDYLVTKGVDANRMSHAGFGETKPVGDNKTKEGRDQNRRVDFELNVK